MLFTPVGPTFSVSGAQLRSQFTTKDLPPGKLEVSFLVADNRGAYKTILVSYTRVLALNGTKAFLESKGVAVENTTSGVLTALGNNPLKQYLINYY